MDERIQREKEYHDQFFDEGNRAQTERFYSVFGPSTVQFEHYLEEHGAGKQVLEIGCGDGQWGRAYFLAERGAQVSAIDISDVAVSLARGVALEKKLDIDFRAMNAEQLAYPDRTFDLIFGQAVIHHLDLNRSYAELVRVLKPGGRAIFVEPLGHNPLINLYRKLTPKLRTADELPLRMKDIQLAKKFFERVDFTPYYLTSLGSAPFYKVPGQKLFVSFFNKLDRVLFALLPFTKRWAWIGVITLERPKK